MNTIPMIGFSEIDAHLDWLGAARALKHGHRLDKGVREDVYLGKQECGYFNRCAWINGIGLVTKSMTVFASNRDRQPPLPAIQGATFLFDDDTGALEAVIDGELITKWKTTADSLLGAQLLAPTDPAHMVILGAGVVAGHHIAAFQQQFPTLVTIDIWNRTQPAAEALARRYRDSRCEVRACTDLPAAVSRADLVTCATMSEKSVLRGDWVSTDTHVDLVGAFLPHMREADDALLLKSHIFVDSLESNTEDIGELAIPLREKIITLEDIRADLYELCDSSRTYSRTPETITVFKNGGGGHLDLMCARYILDTYKKI